MALVVRYFSTTAAGAGDGTTFANRAALFNAGVVSTVISGFAFNAADAMEARVEGGLTYTCGTTIQAASFANPPTNTNPLFFIGCDGSGNRLTIPDPAWTSAQPPWTDTTLPVINTTTNIGHSTLATAVWLLIKFTASGRNGSLVAGAFADWCVFINSTANAAAIAESNLITTNSVLACTGSAYAAIRSAPNASFCDNIRCTGNAGSSGNRDGVAYVGTSNRTQFMRVTSINNGGRGWAYTGTNVAVQIELISSVLANNLGDGIGYPNTASQTGQSQILRNMITGNGGIGLNSGGANTNIAAILNRLRNNTSGDFGTFGNYPTDLYNVTAAGSDADEYVNVAGGDFRIRFGSAQWGKGFGVADQPPAAIRLAGRGGLAAGA